MIDLFTQRIAIQLQPRHNRKDAKLEIGILFMERASHSSHRKHPKRRRFLKRLVFFGGVLVLFWWYFHKEPAPPPRFPDTFPVTLAIDGLALPAEAHTNESVKTFLEREHIPLNRDDLLIPGADERITAHNTITIVRAKHFSITGKDVDISGITTLATVEQLLAEQNIFLNENDLSTPRAESPLRDNTDVTIIRVDIIKKIVKKPIDFEVFETEDPKLSWRKTIIEQKGEPGVREYAYRILSHDGKEIERKLTDITVAKEPVPEKHTQGTLVKVGKSHTGLGTWYAFTGTLAAASPWLPIGSYARVTNTGNGKSVIVKINDRGPFGKNRIIDLDKVAFEKIASLGAGVIEVKVEEITN